MDNERRKKIVIPVVLLLGIFIGGAIVLRTQGIGAQMLTEGKKVLFPIASEPDADPDGDGLKNWQEETYKTDPRNPDTDGDGYLDGEEVASGYDPTIPAPNDALLGTDTTVPRPLPKNLTSYLAQILVQKISSGEIAPAQKTSLEDMENDPNFLYNQELMDEALAQIGLRAKEYFTLPNVGDDEITISPTTTTYESIGAYIMAMSAAMAPSEAVRALNKSEVSAIYETVENKNTGILVPIISSLERNIADAKTITVPQGFENIHKRQISILILHRKILLGVKSYEEDPAMAAAALEVYRQIIDMYRSLSEELNAKIESYQ